MHSDSKIIINQPAGLGDIFFCQKIAHVLLEKYSKIIWPINEHFLFINDYVFHENIEFVSKINFDYCEKQTIDLTQTNSFPGGVMKSKYNSLNVDFHDWQKYFNFSRNYQKERALFDKLNLNENEPYILISEHFGSYPDYIKRKQIDVTHDYKKIYIEIIDDFNVFDWCKVIEHAEEIYIVDTCFNYIIEKLDLKAKHLFLSSRYPDNSFDAIDGLFEKPWVKII